MQANCFFLKKKKLKKKKGGGVMGTRGEGQLCEQSIHDPLMPVTLCVYHSNIREGYFQMGCTLS